MESKQKSSSKPVAKFSSGQIHLAVWENVAKETGEIYNTITIEKRYKSGEEWKSLKSFRPNELSKLISVLQQANEHFASQENNSEQNS
jgi:hypothetical protein